MTLAFVVVACIVIAIILVHMDTLDERRQKAALFYQFSQLGSRYGLSFTSQERLQQRIIGLDALKRKILVFELTDSPPDWYLINLNDVKGCAVKKIYGSIDAGSLDRQRIDSYLEIIALEFFFKDGAPTLALPFYRKLQNDVEEIPELDQKARGWEVMLGKMLMRESKRA